jgi:16S rRNA (uracil1498-N3)-methyltransferase
MPETPPGLGQSERSLQRFFVPSASFHGLDVVFPERTAHQILRVFRLGQGSRVIVLDGTGMEHVVVISATRPVLQGTIASSKVNEAEPQIRLHLYQALLKGKKMELVLQKCTEIGVASFTPITCDRSIVDRVSYEKSSRLMDIVREAAEQCGRGRIPVIEEPAPFKDVVFHIHRTKLILAAPSDRGSMARSPIAIAEYDGETSDIGLFVGPEGGFTSSELDLAATAHVRPITLGRRTLRAETAAIVGSAMVLAAAEKNASLSP